MTSKTLRFVSELAAAGLLAPSEALESVAARYSIAVTPQIAALIDRGDAADPIARQFLPDARELTTHAFESADPIGDDVHSPVPGLVHRYDDRVLLKLVSVCPLYCRFCFRRETVGSGKGSALARHELDAALAYVAARPKIGEVILTGGDPLAVSARRLLEVAEGVARIAHVTTLRAHTRAPTLAPELVTDDRVAALRASGKKLRVALHVNHVRELSPAARDAIAALREAGVELLAQTVLLRGVNDQADALEALLRALVELGVAPYYLHHPDRAPGTAHFAVTLARGRALFEKLEAQARNIALPRYVIDIPGGFGKVPLKEPHAVEVAPRRWRLVDRFGMAHEYRETCDD